MNIKKTIGILCILFITFSSQAQESRKERYEKNEGNENCLYHRPIKFEQCRCGEVLNRFTINTMI